ncbi:hydrogenase nickel incorporation protein HypB [Aneurinibacillus uraniidurans]|uniref:hydrogenase nickel incorporation protein HypB n=1 Tax=Aneurinibacillus uraniidurans TaxID=2966586 RepID=UPI002349B59C|nr:hydrogenase nickel incorporation protein HypB [Aneurinibacillus sp. B1]WCN37436.1 hydrogenase nickel incorporation protein HypB [Aneurinibacillus sp. B1]
MTERIYIERHVLQGNKDMAKENSDRLRQHDILTLNFLSSPGAGKTTLLERVIDEMKSKYEIAVIEGDVATTLDSERIAAHGVHAVQINTHGACHLDAKMIAQALDRFDLAAVDLLIIENVGNLVCPAEFDLGEDLRVVMLSTTEGVDKVAKYPVVFQRADAVILNKTDLLPYIQFDVEQFKADVHRLNPDVPIFYVSALNGEGMHDWIEWLTAKVVKA